MNAFIAVLALVGLAFLGLAAFHLRRPKPKPSRPVLVSHKGNPKP